MGGSVGVNMQIEVKRSGGTSLVVITICHDWSVLRMCECVQVSTHDVSLCYSSWTT